MHFSTLITLTTALLTRQTLATCGEGFPPQFNGVHQSYRLIGPCEVTQPGVTGNAFECGELWDQVPFFDDHFTLVGALTDINIRVNCSPSDQHFFYCTAHDKARFNNPCNWEWKSVTIDRISVP
ncbi:hypothetical protein E4U54_001637 [Claviceps lovelessii]|nr:hypothetical protein E4U54_001637 [Claviceps lovelessii]